MRSTSHARLALLAAFGGVFLWSYWPTFGAMSSKWLHDPQYSHGYLIPVFAAVLLWLRRSQLEKIRFQMNPWGILLIGVGVLVRLAGTWFYFDWLDGVSLLPCLLGLAVLLGGWPALRWSWPAIAFLTFMIPLPYRVETAMSQPLQRLATLGSTYAMQLIGLPALAEGNTILLNQGKIGVVEACSGLSMMLLFFAISTAVALVITRPLLDKILIVISAAPIAVIANVFRITTTGLAQEWISPEAARGIFHDWAGWLMMPVALALLWVELWLLARILVEPTPSRARVVSFGKPAEMLPPAQPESKRRSKRRPEPLPLPCPVPRR